MSQVNVADQAVSFLLAVALGAAAGVYYCFFCALRQWGRKKTWEVFLQDIIFWLIFAVATFCFLLLRCRGEVRGFVYIGEAVGFFIFRLLISRFAINLFLFVFRLFRAVWTPFNRFLLLILSAFSAVAGKFRQNAKKWQKKFKKGRKKGLKAESEVLYNDQEFTA